MELPNVISTFGLAVLYFALRWILSHIGEFSIPPAYLEIAAGLLDVAIAAVAKMTKERGNLPSAVTRGMGEEATPSYWKRVLYK